MLNIAVLVSGGGSNLQAIIDSVERGEIDGTIVSVVSNRADAYALERAKKHHIPSKVIISRQNPDFTRELLEHLREVRADLVVLAGFLAILRPEVIDAFRDRIINVHPSLIPSFCGDGYYGLRVHEKVLEYGVKVTGATVHYVNEITDGGRIILQKAVDILPDDTPETLQRRVMEQAEWIILPQAIQMICKEENKE